MLDYDNHKSETQSVDNVSKLSAENDEINSQDIIKYDPTSDEKICCIELINNNKLYIRFESEWTIKDVIKIDMIKINLSYLFIST